MTISVVPIYGLAVLVGCIKGVWPEWWISKKYQTSL
jgi:hypothetical protein